MSDTAFATADTRARIGFIGLGIMGKPMARNLLRAGYPLVVYNRSRPAMDELAAEGAHTYVNGRTQKRVDAALTAIRSAVSSAYIDGVAADFLNAAGAEAVVAELPTVDILVNNVGVGYGVPEYFASHSEGFHLKLINTNIVSMTMMSEMMLQIMLKQSLEHGAQNRVKGVIINISSVFAYSEIPLASTYSACK